MIHRHMLRRRILGGRQRGPKQGRGCHHAEHAGGNTNPWFVRKHGPASLV
jgi:hypothetical protein